METQGKSLFELALEVVHLYLGNTEVYGLTQEQGQKELPYKIGCLADAMHRAEIDEGVYHWGVVHLRFYHTKNGGPQIVLFEERTTSIMRLPGWQQWKARRAVNEDELINGEG